MSRAKQNDQYRFTFLQVRHTKQKHVVDCFVCHLGVEGEWYRTNRKEGNK